MAVSDEVHRAWAAESAVRGPLWADAVAALTRAAKLTRTRADGTQEPDDFADFLTSAVAAVAANLGSAERVTKGRPGSWEASCVQSMLQGALGDDPSIRQLLALRTAPIQVPLVVAQLVEEDGPEAGLLTLDQALEARPYPGRTEQELIGGVVSTVRGVGATVDELEAHEAAEEALVQRYRTGYSAYAEAFKAAVAVYVATLDELAVLDADGTRTTSVPVEVIVDADPESWAWDNPDEDGDAIVFAIWEAARQSVGLPKVDPVLRIVKGSE